MSINFTAYLFVGSEVPDSHFYNRGKEANLCWKHGAQPKSFCGDCGQRTTENYEHIWTPAMVKAASLEKLTPQEMWEKISPDGGFSWTDSETFGRWSFGYNNEDVMYGTVIAYQRDDEQSNNPNSGCSLDEISKVVSEVSNQFSIFGIELPVQIKVILGCG